MTMTMSTREVADEVGASYRQIDYWIRNEVITCDRPRHGSGNRRRWSPDQVNVVRVVKHLYDHGATAETAAVAARAVDEILDTEGATGMIYVDGRGHVSRVPITGWAIDLAAL